MDICRTVRKTNRVGPANAKIIKYFMKRVFVNMYDFYCFVPAVPAFASHSKAERNPMCHGVCNEFEMTLLVSE